MERKEQGAETGAVAALWRYPVKSMRGEELQQTFIGFPGIYGDRVYAFRSSAAPNGFPYLTAREQGQMLRCRPVFRDGHRMAAPPNLAEAEALAPGVTPLYTEGADMMVDVETPSGDVLAIDDARLIDLLCEGKRAGLALSLIRSDRALTDCRPVSLISIQTTRQIGQGVDAAIDKRRFRANESAWTFFQAQPASYRKAATWWVVSAKKPEKARAPIIAETEWPTSTTSCRSSSRQICTTSSA